LHTTTKNDSSDRRTSTGACASRRQVHQPSLRHVGRLREGISRFTNFSTGADCASTLAACKPWAQKSTDPVPIPLKLLVSRPCRPSRPSTRLRQLRQHHAHDLGACSRLSREASHSSRCILPGAHGRIRKPLSDMALSSHSLKVTPAHNSRRPLKQSTTPARPSAQVKPAFPRRLSNHWNNDSREAVRTATTANSPPTFAHLAHHRFRFHQRSAEPPRHRCANPGDISSAAFFLCAAAIFPGSSLLLDSLGLNPTRATLLDVLTALGAKISVLNLEERMRAGRTVQISAPPRPWSTEVSGALAAQLIDECRFSPPSRLHQRRHPHPRRQRAPRQGIGPHRL